MNTFNSISLVWCCSMILYHVFCFYLIVMLCTITQLDSTYINICNIFIMIHDTQPWAYFPIILGLIKCGQRFSWEIYLSTLYFPSVYVVYQLPFGMAINALFKSINHNIYKCINFCRQIFVYNNLLQVY